MVSNKTWLIGSITSLALLASFPEHSVASTFTLDWEQIAEDGAWTSGSLDGGRFNVGSGFLDISFEQGDGVNFVGFGGGSVTPEINTVLNGTAPDTDRSLHLQIDAEQVGLEKGSHSITMNAQFDGYLQPITDISFWLYDIDIQSNAWQDRVILRGFQGTELVNPSFNFLYPDTNTVEIVDSFTLDGIRPVGNNDDQSNVLVTFTETIDRFEMIFTDGDNLGDINPTSHGIGIGDISFTETEASKSVPEPSSLLSLIAVGGLTIIGRHTGLKRRSIK